MKDRLLNLVAGIVAAALYLLAFLATGVVYWLLTGGYEDEPRRIYDTEDIGGSGADLDCVDIGEEIWVGAYDPHGLDGDNDGWGCEGW